jgi:amino-acid N-acetyltransferase
MPRALPQSVAEMRPATVDDLNAVLGLLETSHLPTAGVQDHLEHFVLEFDGETLIGCAGLEVHDGAGLLRSVAVASDHRSSGLGSRLTDAVLEMAQTQHLSSLSLLTETAQEYFSRFGFERTERRRLPSSLQASREFQGACPDSAVAMTLVLR